MLKLNHTNRNEWKAARGLVKEIYRTTEVYPTRERYGLTAQSRRAAMSVLANLPEGSAMRSHRERLRYYEISRGSLVELDTHLEIAKELHDTDGTDLTKQKRN